MKILLVEDDDIICEWISKIILRMGHDLIIAYDGNEALEKNRSGTFDLIITDILMPHKEGIELIHEIRNTQSDIKILAISSAGKAGHVSFIELAEAVGANVRQAQRLQAHRHQIR